MPYLRAILCTVVLILDLVHAERKAVDLLGAGASFPSAVYSQWIHLYRRHRFEHVDIRMKYDSVGSGNGIALIKQDQIQYAGSDVPLTKQEMKNYPDLKIIPTMAGAIVLGFNIPNVKQLNISLEAIVGIYNGTIRRWNDTMITHLNPGVTLPFNAIVVIARGDTSGSTGIFTRCLSAYSAEWKSAYGSFTEGRESSTRLPVKWNKGIVKFYGETNLGMTGLLLSMDYSVGYVAASHAFSSKITYAKIMNSVGNILNATAKTVQNSITSMNGSYDIINTKGRFAYPIASFTYFIIKMSTMEDCDAAIELIRYVKWLYFSEQAHEEAVRQIMVPLDNETASRISNDVLKRVTCQGQNVWELMLKQIEEESIVTKDKAWQIPVMLGMCLLMAVITGLLVHLGRQQILLHRELLKETWNIDKSLISVNWFYLEGNERTVNPPGSSYRYDLSKVFVFTDNTLTNNRFCVGGIQESPITLIKMHNQPVEFTMAEKKTLIRMSNNIRHSNILQFLGVTKINGNWSYVYNEFIRGSLSEMLQSKSVEVNTEGIVALSKSLVKGLLYLHKKGMIHGHLTGMSCLIDSSWELKIADWVETQLSVSTKVDRNKVSSCQAEPQNDITLMLWLAPEILKFKRLPTQASDVYSLSMVLQEMFTKQEPYSEFSMSYSEIINAISTCGIRPKVPTETPTVFRTVIETSWETDPATRPKIDFIYNLIKTAYPADTSFLDCMIRSIEQYAKQLEDKIKDQDISIEKLDETKTACIYQSVPPFAARALMAKTKVVSESKENVCILACKVSSISSIVRHVTVNGIVNLLNSFYMGMDQLLLQDDIYRLNRYATESIFAVGLEKPIENRKIARKASLIALKLKNFAEKFNRERLIGINTNITLQIGLASGTVATGIMGNVVPQYTVLGDVSEDALELARKAQPGEIRVSERICTDLVNEKSIATITKTINNDVCYSLDSKKMSIRI